MRRDIMEWHRNTTSLQFDISSHCNARCGACVRNVDGGETEKNLPLAHFDFELWKRIAYEDTHRWYMHRLNLNGNWGDPMMHPKLVEMMEVWLDAHPRSTPSIATNGSMRGPKFWHDLANVLHQFPNHKVDFSIDGMGDTHDIYRRRTDFSKICENVKSFSDAGGHATIQFTMFEHNKHQHQEIEDLARSLGAMQLVKRRSHSPNMVIKDKDEEYTITATDGIPESRTRLKDDRIESTNPHKEHILEIGDMYDTYLNTSEKQKTKCPWYNQQEIQIDPWGTVWPCCHVSLFGVDLEKHTLANEVDETFVQARKDNNLHDHSLYEILSSDWYNEHVKLSVKGAKWKTCQRTCGVEA